MPSGLSKLIKTRLNLIRQISSVINSKLEADWNLPPPTFFNSKFSQSTRLGPCTIQQLPAIHFTHNSEYMSRLPSQFIPSSFSQCVHRSILYTCVSIPSQIGSLISFLQIPYVSVIIQYFFLFQMGWGGRLKRKEYMYNYD